MTQQHYVQNSFRVLPQLGKYMWKLYAEINFRQYLKCDCHRAGIYCTHAPLIHVLTCRTPNSFEIGNFVMSLTKTWSYAFHCTVFMKVIKVK